MSTLTDRKFVLPLAELVDRLTVDQIKEVLLPGDKDSFAREIAALEHDIDLVLREGNVECTARLLRIVIVIAQMNLHVWHLKDEMARSPERYDELLKLAHQLNGVRNQMKNQLLQTTGNREAAALRSNTQTDGLQGWNISL